MSSGPAAAGHGPDMSWAAAASKHLLALLQRSDTNVVLCFDEERELHAHSQPLALSSPVLADMLEVARGATQGGRLVLTLSGDDPQHWLSVLEHLYPLCCNMNWDSISQTLVVAHKYDMQQVLASCVGWVQRQSFSDAPGQSYVLQWLELGGRLHICGITEHALAFIKQELDGGRTAILADKVNMSRLTPSLQADIIYTIATCNKASFRNVVYECFVCKARYLPPLGVSTCDVRQACPQANFGSGNCKFCIVE